MVERGALLQANPDLAAYLEWTRRNPADDIEQFIRHQS